MWLNAKSFALELDLVQSIFGMGCSVFAFFPLLIQNQIFISRTYDKIFSSISGTNSMRIELALRIYFYSNLAAQHILSLQRKTHWLSLTSADIHH